MWKVVKGNVDELEAKLNQAAVEGFTEIVREFPPDFRLTAVAVDVDEASRGLIPAGQEPPLYAFLLRRRQPTQGMDEVRSLFSEIKEMMGIGSRFGGKPDPTEA